MFKTLHILIALPGICFHSLPLVSFFGYIYMVSAVVWLSHSFLNDVKRRNIWHKLKGMLELWLSSILLFILPKDSEILEWCSDSKALIYYSVKLYISYDYLISSILALISSDYLISSILALISLIIWLYISSDYSNWLIEALINLVANLKNENLKNKKFWYNMQYIMILWTCWALIIIL